MDPFTQRLLERTEQRSKALGITNKAKVPLTEFNQEPLTPHQTRSSSPSKTPSPTKRTNIDTTSAKKQIQRTGSVQVSSSTKDSKENVDLAVEINITTGPNVQIQVEVEEQEIDEYGNVLSSSAQNNGLENGSGMPPMIRDSSRNRLQRLGALYSETENLSSPIHRTEARFDDNLQQTPKANDVPAQPRPTKRIGKLAALADSINNWEDDLSHPDASASVKAYREVSPKRSPAKTISTSEPRVVGTSLRKQQPQAASPKQQQQQQRYDERAQVRSILSAKTPPKLREASSTAATTVTTLKMNSNDSRSPSKQLKWDQQVMDALEQQGFQRRESTTSKLVYDFKGRELLSRPETDEPSPKKNEKKTATKFDVSRGLVSGRTALFENVQKAKSPTRLHKDPAELSIRERLALFERNKGNALIPKAALGMAPSAKQIMADRKEEKNGSISTSASAEKQKINTYNKPVFAESHAAGNSIRSTVAALMSNATTISESQIATDIRKQREKEMNILLNRYNRPAIEDDFVTNEPPAVNTVSLVRSQKQLLNKQYTTNRPTAPPPPAPPMPNHLLLGTIPRHVEAKCLVKRKSNENFTDDDEHDTTHTVVDDSKRMKVNPIPKAPRLYPALSDIESTTGTESEHDNCTTATVSEEDQLSRRPSKDQQHHMHRYNDSYDDDNEEDSYMEEDGDSSTGICNVSLGHEIMQAVRQNDRSASRIGPQHKRNSGGDRASAYNDSSSASECIDDGDMDEYLDEALEEDGDDFDSEEQITPKKGSISSSSFSYAKSPSKQLRQQTIYENDNEVIESHKTPIRSELTVNPSDDSNLVTLTHTVSFYRRQQSQSVSNTPVRKVTYADNRGPDKIEDDDIADEPPMATNNSQSANDREVSNKVARLSLEIDKQHQMMKQTSQALNLCAATFEFSGSTESVDAERHLLVATQRREAALHELARLQHQRCLRMPGTPTDRGKLTIQEIIVPLRPDYKEKMDSSTICGHHLVCLLRCNEYVEATRTVPTLPGLLAVKFPDKLQIKDVYADFKATLEIYGMIAQREVLPHDIKYHINKKGPNKTPKKKGADSRLIMPPVESAGGPQVVRTPALSRYGVVEFSLREIQRPSWTLTKVTGVSPLQGVVHMKVNCELSVSIDHKGFLTMFEDVAGFGAWHRRWCRLHGHLLSYWRYPDDEKTKAPMGSIDLKNCCTKQVTTAPRDICARLNTFLFECKRQYQPDDKNSLIVVRQGKYTIIRHLLSADTKQERETWCAHFNKALVVIRSWDQPSQ